ncbi:translation initiation factor SUI1 [Chytridium lagenaria]|nr:translation initiation factor SUI1 [Chytridium lagenaria]
MTRVIENVLYCKICQAPVEYCSFGPSEAQCKLWLLSESQDMYIRVWGSEGLELAEKKDAATEQPDKVEKKKKSDKKSKKNKIELKKSERAYKKSAVTVSGLHLFNVDLKRASKLFATKFACGCSVTKGTAGFDEIIVQGDISEDMIDFK